MSTTAIAASGVPALVYELVIRDIKVRYKRSVLGVFWTMLAPLLNMVALTLVFSSILKQQIRNYPVYFMTGSILWTYFSQATSSAASQTQDSNELAKRIYIPRSVFVASSIGVGLVNQKHERVESVEEIHELIQRL